MYYLSIPGIILLTFINVVVVSCMAPSPATTGTSVRGIKDHLIYSRAIILHVMGSMGSQNL